MKANQDKIRAQIEEELAKPEPQRNYRKIERLTQRWCKAAGVAEEIDAAAIRGISKLTASEPFHAAEEEHFQVEVQRHPQWMQILTAAACLVAVVGTGIWAMHLQAVRRDVTPANVETETTAASMAAAITETQPATTAPHRQTTQPETVPMILETVPPTETQPVTTAPHRQTTQRETISMIPETVPRTETTPAPRTTAAAETAGIVKVTDTAAVTEAQPVETAQPQTETSDTHLTESVPQTRPTETYVIERDDAQPPELPGFRFEECIREGMHWQSQTDPVTGQEQLTAIRIESPGWRIVPIETDSGSVIPDAPAYLPEGMALETENAPAYDGMWFTPPKTADGSPLFDNYVIYRQYPAAVYFCGVPADAGRCTTEITSVTVNGAQGFICKVNGTSLSPYHADTDSHNYTEYYLVWQTADCIHELWAFDIPEDFVDELYRIAESVQPLG